MPIAIKTTKDIKTNGIKAVIYGFAGSGKTILCSTAPKPIIISADEGLISLSEKDVPCIEVRTMKDIGDAYLLIKDNNDYQTICIDCISEISEIVLAKVLKSDDVITKGGKIELRIAYRLLASIIMPMIRNFRNIRGKNIVFISKAKTFEDEDTQQILTRLMIPGRVVPNNLPYLVDEVLFLGIDRQGDRFLQCQESKGVYAKDRSSKLNEIEKIIKDDDKSLDKIFKKMLK